MRGKIVLITGATSGIGRITARELARKGATTVVVGRDPGKCERVVEEIRRETGNPSVEFLVGDLARMADVRRVAGEFRARHDRLDVLINNAGALFSPRQVAPQGEAPGTSEPGGLSRARVPALGSARGRKRLRGSSGPGP